MPKPDETKKSSDDAGSSTSLALERAFNGDRESWDRVVGRLTPLLLLQAKHHLGTALGRFCDPEDLVAEVWLVALEKLPGFTVKYGHRTPVVVKYLSTTLRNRLSDLVKKHLRKPGDDREAPLSADPSASSPGVATLAAIEEGKNLLRDLLAQLTEEERALLVLRGVEDLPTAEVATLMGLTPNTVAVRHRRLLARLREQYPDSVLAEL